METVSRSDVLQRAKALASQLKQDRYVYYLSEELGYVVRSQPPVTTRAAFSHWKITPGGEVYRHQGSAEREYEYVPVKE